MIIRGGALWSVVFKWVGLGLLWIMKSFLMSTLIQILIHDGLGLQLEVPVAVSSQTFLRLISQSPVNGLEVALRCKLALVVTGILDLNSHHV